MAETTNAELKIMLEQQAAAAERRDIAHIERSVRLQEQLSAVTTGLTTLEQRFVAMEREIPSVKSAAEKAVEEARGAVKDARSAMQSHDDLQKYVHSTWNEQHADLKSILEQQNKDRDRIEQEKKEEYERVERAKKEALEQESLAIRRLNDERTHREKMATAMTPTIVAIIGVLGTIAAGFSAYYSARAAHQDTNAKLDRVANLVSAIPEAPPATSGQFSAIESSSIRLQLDGGAEQSGHTVSAPAAIPFRSTK